MQYAVIPRSSGDLVMVVHIGLCCYINFPHSTLWINIWREARGVRCRIREKDGEGEARRGWKKWEPSNIACFLLFMSYKEEWRGRKRRDCSFPSFPWVSPSIGPAAAHVSTADLSVFFYFLSGHHSFSLSLSCRFELKEFCIYPRGRAAQSHRTAVSLAKKHIEGQQKGGRQEQMLRMCRLVFYCLKNSNSL